VTAEHNHPPRCCCPVTVGKSPIPSCPSCPDHGTFAARYVSRCTCDPGPEGQHQPWCALHSQQYLQHDHGASTPYTEQETTNG